MKKSVRAEGGTGRRRGAGLGVVALWFALAAAAWGETVTVAPCVRDAAVDFWGSSDVRFCRNVMDEVFALAGVQPKRVPYGKDGMLVVSNTEVVCSAFRTSKMLEDYDFPLQPLGLMHYGLYAAPERAEKLRSLKITEWPRMKVAYSPVAQGQRGNTDREDYFKRANLAPDYVEYPTSSGAVEALQKGEVDVLFLYTPFGDRPDGVEEIVPIGARNVYFAVRKDRPELKARLAAAYREWYVDNVAKRDLWAEQLLGIPKPEKRVRVAAYNRGDLFQVTPDGRRSGSIEEWLRALCEVTGWTLDYVYGDYDQSLEDVKNGRLDLFGGIGYTPEYAGQFLFPHTPIGILRIYLWTHRNTPYKAGKPETWTGMTIGAFSGAPTIDLIREQVAKSPHGLKLREYDSDRELGDDYEAGKVDACVAIEMPMLANDRALRFYGAHQMYLVCATNQPGIFGQLERALDQAGDDFPKYVRMLSERHYGSHSGLSELSIAEAEWLAQRQKDPTPIAVDFSPWPFEVVDRQGRPEGFPKALLGELSRRTGLKFVPAEQTGRETAEAKFLRGDTMLWVPYPADAEEAKYGAVTVFAEPVPHHCAQAFGAEDLLDEFELLARPEMPEELVSILRKMIAGISSERIQEMFAEAVVERLAEQRLFGLDEEDLKHYGAIAGLVFFVLVTLYGAVMMVLLKKHARRAEESALHAGELAAAKTKFLAMMSHELRTPLNAVIGFAEFLSQEGLSEKLRGEYTEGILTSANALLALINDILDFSKLDAGAMNMREGECDVEKTAAELLAIFGYLVGNRGIRFSVRRSSFKPVPMLKLSTQGLRRILINLVGNSAKFTKEGEIVVEYGWEAETRTLRVATRDTGCGISDAKMRHLFDPFVQDIATRMQEAHGEIQGTGLGLPIVKRLVDNAGGTLDIESQVGRGTWILIEIPNIELAEPAEEKAPVPAGPIQVPESVLVVDDMVMNRKILGIHLANIGVKDIRYAENGVKALDLMENWTPEVVLTDMWMPEMDGQKLSEAMRRDPRLAKIPLVAVTADVDVDSTYDMNLFARVIAKPVTGEKLRTLFREL